jgi:hypothetical protein
MCKVRAATWTEAICKMPFWQITIDQKSRVVLDVFQSWNTYWEGSIQWTSSLSFA